MNDGQASKSPKGVKSSFDWSSVRLAYASTHKTLLPKGRSKKLPSIQHKFRPESPSTSEGRQARRREVKELFRKNWQSYRRYAWKKDALQPISAGFKDQFSGWAATLVDSLDSLWIMGFKEEFDEAVAAVAEIDFGKSSTGSVNTFETTIRYLGGLLAAYDLSGREVLLTKATELGDLIYSGFNTPNRMPVDFIDVEQAKTGRGLMVEGSVVSASPGTLSLELTHLSQLTGDPKYYDAVSHVMRLFFDGQNKTRLPGIWPIYVSMSRQDVVSGSAFTLAGNADSLYEYLPKMYALLGGREPMYETMSTDFMRTANKHFFFRPMLPHGDDILISGNVNIFQDDKPELDPESEHLACFIGGTMALGGRLFKQPDDVQTGAKLARGCAFVYQAFPTGIMPERYNMVACEPQRSSECKWDDALWAREKQKRPEWLEHLPIGFTTAKDPRYLLRPEAIESIFVLYRITGDPAYQDIAWEMFKAISKGTRTEYANAAVLDVTRASEDLEKEDYMEVNSTAMNCTSWRSGISGTDSLIELLACRDPQVLLPCLLPT
jgi:mannosyl-oligosaccharide alpha-1,2-mannosidase